MILIRILQIFMLFFGANFESNFGENFTKNLSENSGYNLIVDGYSMEPIFSNHDFIHVDPITRETPLAHGDIIIVDLPYDLDNGSNMIVKRIVGIPGDAWTLSGANIVIDGEVATSSEGNAYEIHSAILDLYARDYPIIPSDRYLIFGNLTTGSYDSTEFGFVARDQIIGRVK